jgi:putative sigma-54 modulation protein
MRVEITSKSLEVTDAMRDHVEKRLIKLKRYFDGVLDCHVVIRVERFIYTCEITLHGQGFDFFSEGHAEEVYAALDAAADKMETQVRKMKDKIRAKRGRRPTAESATPAESGEPAEIDDFLEES